MRKKIALPEAEAARIAAESWAPGGPDPEEGAAAPRQMTSRPPGGERLSSGGSGFIVSRAGDVLTNQHVVDACRQVRVLHNGAPVVATVIATDPTADLAICACLNLSPTQRWCAAITRSSQARLWSSAFRSRVC